MYYAAIQPTTSKLTPNAIKILESKRYLRGETPEQMFWRVANYVASAEKIYEATNEKVEMWATYFYNAMSLLDFLPNSPTLFNAGRPLGQLSACFVVPVEDSMEGIFQAIKDMALIQKTGGGTGFDFSKLRPVGDPVSSTDGQASGPISFMRAFNECTDVIKQGGTRRGANMGIMRIDHPDILEFIDVKQDLNELNNFNISIAITDEFMDCLLNNKPFALRFNGVIYMKINPRHLWEKIVESAWLTGEPGVIFIDTINKYNPTPQLGKIESTNPCGEQPLLPYESCNLGSINLANMVIADVRRYKIDWDRLRDAIHVATRFLDNIIDINKYPLPQIEERTKLTRKIGLGVMGWADLLFKLEIPYDSAEALHLAAEIMSFIQKESHAYSSEILAKERGCFPAWKESVWGQHNIPMRNATTTTIAPTGTISLIAGVSSGIEPVFALAYTKTLVDGGGIITELNPSFLEALRQRGYTADEIEAIASQVSQTGTLRGLSLSRDITEVFVTALEIHPFDHVQMQAMFQNYTDNAVSKTINFNNDVTHDDISETLLSAYKLGCKGITVYRDGSRDSQPLIKGQKVEKEEEVVQEQEPEANIVHKVKTKPVTKAVRPVELTGITKQVRTGCGTMFITINDYNGAIYEVFLKAGATGGCAAFTEGTARLISIALRYGVPVEEIIDQLRSVRCDNFRHQSGKDPQLKGKSCPDVVGRIMQEFIDGQKEKQSEHSTLSILEAAYQASLKDESLLKMQIPIAVSCPECGQELRMAEGCVVCLNCGYSRC